MKELKLLLLLEIVGIYACALVHLFAFITKQYFWKHLYTIIIILVFILWLSAIYIFVPIAKYIGI
jgi:hypothetical protein